MQDQTLLTRFLSGEIASEHWNHEAHIRVAYLLLCQHDFDEALDLLRDGIQAVNRAHGVHEAADSGYHETLTVAWLRIVNAHRPTGPQSDSQRFCTANPQLLDRRLLREFYSSPRITTWEAKRSFVEPDLRALP